jgi:hypothetical protein
LVASLKIKEMGYILIYNKEKQIILAEKENVNAGVFSIHETKRFDTEQEMNEFIEKNNLSYETDI